MLKLRTIQLSILFDKVKIGRLNFYPIKFDLKDIPQNIKSLDELLT